MRVMKNTKLTIILRWSILLLFLPLYMVMHTVTASAEIPTTARDRHLIAQSNTDAKALSTQAILIIGAGEFENQAFTDLTYPGNQARSFHKLLLKEEGIDKSEIRLLDDKYATRQSIRTAVGDFASHSSATGTDILYLSGIVRTVGNKQYLLTYDCNPDQIEGTALSMDDFAADIRKAGKNRKLIILDAINADPAQLSANTGQIVLASGSAGEVIAEADTAFGTNFSGRLIDVLRTQNPVTLNDAFQVLRQDIDKATMSKQVPRLIGYQSGAELELNLIASRSKAVAGKSKNKQNSGKQKEREGIEEKWAIIVGISQYENPPIPPLRHAAKDAISFYDFLVNEAEFRKDHVLLITDEKATLTKLRRAFGLGWLYAVGGSPNDLLVVYISAHGQPDRNNPNGSAYILTHDSEAKDLRTTALAMKELQDLISSNCNARRKMIFLDTCYSGDFIESKSVVAPGNANADAISMGTGTRIMCSSAANEQSWESSAYENSIFTHYLLEGLRLKKKNVDVEDAYNYLVPLVQKEARQSKSAPQTPKIGGAWDGQELVLSVKQTVDSDPFPEVIEFMNRSGSIIVEKGKK